MPAILKPTNMPKIISVQLDDKKIEVRKLPILRYAEMLKAVKELPKHLSGMDMQNTGVDKIFEQLPYLIAVALPDIINIISIATDLEKDEIEQLGLDEVTSLAVAIAEVNNYQGVFDKVKKALAHPSLKTLPKKTS